MKKLFALSFLVFALFAGVCFQGCSSDDDHVEPSVKNPSIVDGVVNDIPMLFVGTSVSTSPEGETFTDTAASFEIVADDHGTLTLYMHGPRFAAAMPGVEMRILNLEYTGSGTSVGFSAESAVPEAQITGVEGWQPFERFTVTALEGRVKDSHCMLTFGCIGYRATFEGRLVVK